MNELPKAAPVALSERIESLDVLRGFAVLGILVMNIQDFSMIGAAYMNPTAYGDLTGINYWVWLVSHIFADQKFMTIFSLLFGAGIVLFADRVAARGGSPAWLHYRRTFWLLVLGGMHAYLLWRGDILFSYAMCALLVYLFRRLPPTGLFILGTLVLLFCSGMYFLFGWSIPYWDPEQLGAMVRDMWRPEAADVAAEIAAYTGNWPEQMTERVPQSIAMQTSSFFFYISWRAGGLMLLGMALYRWGVLSARLSSRFYAVMTVVGLAAGIPLIAYGAGQHAAYGWKFEYSFFLIAQYNYYGSLFVAAGYIGLVMWLVKTLRNGVLFASMARVGRMAFSNYILQTVLCTTLFYGHGLGLFGSVPRWGQILIVFAVWIACVVVSNLWLAHFRFGPMEWLWRSLTYWKLQPMRKADAGAVRSP